MSARHPLGWALALVVALLAQDARALDSFDRVNRASRPAWEAYVTAWKACWSEDWPKSPRRGCQADAVATAFEAYTRERDWLCAQPLTHRHPFVTAPGQPPVGGTLEARKRQQSEFFVWREFCAWSDPAVWNTPGLYFAPPKGRPGASVLHDAERAEGYLRQLRGRFPARDAWWYPYSRYVEHTRIACRYVAEHGISGSGYEDYDATRWAARCASDDLLAFAGTEGAPTPPPTPDPPPAVDPPAPRPPTVAPPEPPPVPRDVELSVTLAGHPPDALAALPVPGELALVVSAVDGAGTPLRLARVEVTLEDPRPRFVKLDRGPGASFDRLDDAGRWEAKLVLRTPKPLDDYLELTEVPLAVTLAVTLKTDGGAMLARARWTRPLNLALFHGVTLGPDLKPRDAAAPSCQPSISLVAEDRRAGGAFAVLVHPLSRKRLAREPTFAGPPAPLAILWPDDTPLWVDVPTVAPGGRYDLGERDVLTVAEHEARIREVVARFVRAMPLAPAVRDRTLTHLAAVPFVYDPAAGDTIFREEKLGPGRVVVGDTAAAFWGRYATGNFLNALHELGHFMHHTLVERHPYWSIKYGYMHRGHGHNTWSPAAVEEDAYAATHRRFTSFTEATADLFALLALVQWRADVPDVTRSVYYRLDWLGEYGDDAGALRALADHPRGDEVEGVQARFLVALYGRAVDDAPAWVFADFVATMAQFAEDLDNLEWYMPGAAARTIDRWIWAKAHNDSAIGVSVTGDPFLLASRYRLLDAPPIPTLSQLDTGARLRVGDGPGARELRFDATPVTEVPLNTPLTVRAGTVVADLSTAAERRVVRLATGTEVVIRGPGLIALRAGQLTALDGVTVVTPTALLQPKGTFFSATVAEDGATQVVTHHGQVRVDGRAGAAPVVVTAGMGLVVDPTGTPSTPTTAPSAPPPIAAAAERAFVLAGASAGVSDGRAARALVLAVAGLALWLAAALLWIRRRRRPPP